LQIRISQTGNGDIEMMKTGTLPAFAAVLGGRGGSTRARAGR